MKRQGTVRFLLIALWGLSCVLHPPAAAGRDAPAPSRGFLAITRAAAAQARSFEWLKPLSDAWREEYVKTYLTGYLFRENVSYCPYDAPDKDLAAEGGAPASETRGPSGGIDCGRRCRMGERNLAAGYLPEALAEYMTAAEKGCPYETEGCRPAVGMLKADLAMGRFSEAQSLFHRLRAEHDTSRDDVLILIEGVLAALDRHYESALQCFTRAGGAWHLCANLEDIAGYALFRRARYEDARNVFRVAMHSPWRTVRDFGVLGLADSTLALGLWVEAEPLYASLAKDRSPIGLLGQAEFLLKQGKLGDARKDLSDLVASADRDYWKGVGLTYLMSMTPRPAQWAETLRLAEQAKALVLQPYWAEQLRKRTVQALEAGIRSLWAGNAHDKLLILAEAWRRYQPDLRQDAQLLIGRSYEEAALHDAALEVYGRLSSIPDALFRGARLAWKCGKYADARALLEKYLATKDKGHRNEAKILLACVYARNHRLDLARKYLRGAGRVQDPSLLIALGKVEASMGMRDLAIQHLRSALVDATISGAERRHLFYILAGLNYQLGRFKEARNYFRMAAAGDKGEGEGGADPMEVLCIAHLDELAAARTALGKLPKDSDTDVVAQILDTRDLFKALRREGHER